MPKKAEAQELIPTDNSAQLSISDFIPYALRLELPNDPDAVAFEIIMAGRSVNLTQREVMDALEDKR